MYFYPLTAVYPETETAVILFERAEKAFDGETRRFADRSTFVTGVSSNTSAGEAV